MKSDTILKGITPVSLLKLLVVPLRLFHRPMTDTISLPLVMENHLDKVVNPTRKSIIL